MRKKALFILLSICLFFYVFNIQGSAVSETGAFPETVTVGFYEKEGFFENHNGVYSGFGIDYLNSIAAYTGWKYEFAEGTRQECARWLAEGSIDLLLPVYSDEKIGRAKNTSNILGEDFCYIYKLDHNFEITYKDYEKFEECIVGTVAGSDLDKRIEEYCRKNNFHFDSIIKYPTLDVAEKELADGKIDLLATDSYVNITNMKVVDSFVSGLITVAVNGADLLEELENSMDLIKLDNPGYTEELRGRYFSEGSQKNLEYSMEELEFLSSEITYKVALCENQYPISFVDEDGNYRGIALDIIKIVEYHTGISIEKVYVENYDTGEKMLGEGKVDFLAGAVVEKQEIANWNLISKSTKEPGKKEYLTEFFNMDMSLVGKKGTDLSATLDVAVPFYMKRGIECLKELYPQYNYIVYMNDDACFEAIIKKEVQLAVQSDTKINELGNYDEYKEIRNLKNVAANFVAAFVIRTDKSMPVKILKKTMDGLTQAAVSAVESNNIAYIEAKGMTVEEFLDNYLDDVIVSVIIVLMILLGLTMYLKYKREQRSKEKAYRDSIANISSMEKFRIDVEPILRDSDKCNYYVIAVDLDKFKVINDLYGYENGDRVLAFLAKKYAQGLQSDDYITRSVADNFIIFKKADTVEQVGSYLKQVFAAVDQDMERYESHFYMILKAGIYRIEENDYILSSVIDKANLAKNNMKRSHISSYELYNDTMRRKNIEDKEMENDMEEALQTDQFHIYLQPQVDLHTKKIVSAEALVRWFHPEKGMISPLRFIPLFENNGFITKLDIFVWEEVMKTIADWQENHKIVVPVAINFSRVDMEKADTIELFMELMKKYKLDPSFIKAELTESVCLENDTLVMERMHQLKEYGFKIAVDDFGSGYSSLHLLKNMPLDILKIDKSFLEISADMSYRDKIIIKDVVEIGKHLGLQTIMEGVETKEQSDFLETIGCDIAQGYFFGKPMPVKEFEKLLEKNDKQEGEKL